MRDDGSRIGGQKKPGIAAGLLIGLAGCLSLLLIVVFGAGLLFYSSTQMAGFAAKRAACTSNMKQLAMAMLMYSQDYDGKFPIAARWDVDIQPYIKNTVVLRCPARPYPNGYAFNSLLSGVDSNRLVSPASVPMLFESSSGSPGTSDPLTTFFLAHDDQGGVAWADGHVTLVPTAPSSAVKLSKTGASK
jgi:prepilin-type processing-associated H-X9-DG protein